MNIKKICVLGGSGFVGQHLVSKLCERGYEVRVPYRNINRAKHLTVLPAVSLVEADIHDPVALTSLLQGMDAVINLVGILHEHKRGAFQRAHVDLPRKVIEACKANGIKRLIHMSAIGVSKDGLSQYQRTKGEGEALVREAHGEHLAVTVFRPSVIFGAGDKFLNLFAGLLNWTPVFPLGSPLAKMQPVHVGDVAQAMAVSVNNVATFGESYDLCGPKVYTLWELVEYVAKVKGLHRVVMPLSPGMSSLQATVFGLMPIKLLTHDNYLTLKTDAVCHCPFPEVFGIRPVALEAEAPLFLAPTAPPLFRRFISEKR